MYHRMYLINKLIDKIQKGKPISFVIPKENRFHVSHQEHHICIFSHELEAITLTKENAHKVLDDLKVSDEELYNILIDL